MIRVVKKKSYSKRKTEDYRFQRKVKFALSRLGKVLQIVAVMAAISLCVWVFGFGGDTVIKNYTHKKATEFFISLGLKIESVEIRGNKIVPTDIILKKIFESLGDVTSKSIVLLDITELQDDITSIGWIESVTIKKKMPGKLIVNVTERSPKIIWQSKGAIWLADQFGNLLTQKMEKKYIYLPLVIGQNADKDIPELFRIINSSTRFKNMIVRATKTGGRRWDIKLNNDIVIKLPEDKPVEAWKKLDVMEKQSALFSKRITYIDMRIEGQLVTGVEKEQQDEISDIIQTLDTQTAE